MRGKHKHKKQRNNTPPQPEGSIAPRVDQEMSTEPNSNNKRKADKEEPKSFVKLIKSDPKFRVEVAAVIVGLLVLIIYWRQLRVMDQTEKIDQRAWVSVSYGNFDIKEGDPIIAPITITNTGKTAAKNMEGFLFVTPFKSHETPTFGPLYTPGFGWLRTVLNTGMLVPNSPATATLTAVKKNAQGAEPIIMTHDLAQEVINGESVLMVYGTINYTDIFGVKHWVKFCGFHGATGGEAGKKCVAYNDIDND